MVSSKFQIRSLEDLAIPGVCLLILFLSYTSQYLFLHIEPGRLDNYQSLWFNIFIVGIWLSYYLACTVDPAPKGWVERVTRDPEDEDTENPGNGRVVEIKMKKGMRWCKKCENIKPPRAHHCKQCKRCVPKMDHHCPWTRNCVSHLTFPHFIRFVFYAVLSMSLLEYYLCIRLYALWESRNLPSYLGPPIWALAHLMILFGTNSLVLFALTILLLRAAYGAAMNTTMIETWEIERHEAVVERARKNGGYVHTNGQKLWIERQEFPYDIGIWKNLCQSMGTSNVLLWLLPFGGGPGVDSAGNWETNGFEDGDKIWPPVDPEKIARVNLATMEQPTLRVYGSAEEEIAAFKERQRKDYERWSKGQGAKDEDYDYESEYEEGMDGEEGWTNSDGDRLRDYGVDEDTEIIDDENLPLGHLREELLRRRNVGVKR